MINSYVKILGASAFATAPIFGLAATPNEKPNVVLIFVDDMGYGDIAPFGSDKHPTPHLQRMADEGICHTQFYMSSTNSTPSRSALMTGCYASTVGMGYRVLYPADVRGLNPDEVILPEIFKEKGYATGCFGKWHMGDNLEYMPINHGFDEFEGLPYSTNMSVDNAKGWNSLPYIIGEKVVAKLDTESSQTLMTQLTTENTVDFIRRHKDEPFFVYVPYTSLHNPRYVREEYALKHNGDILAAQIEEVDNGVGAIMQSLKDLGLDDNTLVIFSSDNGGGPESSMHPLRGQKGGVAYEGRAREPMIMRYPNVIEAGVVSDKVLATKDILPSLAKLIGVDTSICKPLDGVDQLDVFFGVEGATSLNDTLYYQFESVFDAVRVGDLKLIRSGDEYELYDLANDIGESSNVIDKYPQQVEQMKQMLYDHTRKQHAKARPSGFVADPKPLIEYASEVPELYEYKNMPAYKAVQQVSRKKKKR